ncbi:hypothetical protein OS42_35600 [Dickeya oryzae]
MSCNSNDVGMTREVTGRCRPIHKNILYWLVIKVGVHMQGTKFSLFVGGVLLAMTVGNVQAEALQPDPAWQQGKLDNGFSWQLLATPQRQ